MKANRIVACGLVAVALACAGVRPAVAAESYWYGEVNAAGNYVADPMGQSSFTNSAFWSLTKDVRPIVYDGSFQDSKVDYYLLFNGACRTPRLATSEWNGKSLHVGSQSLGKNSTLAFCAVNPTPITVTFHNDGLFLERGMISQYNNTQASIKGKVQVLSTQANKIISTINNNIGTSNGAADSRKIGLDFQCPVSGPATAWWLLSTQYDHTSNGDLTSDTGISSYRFTDLTNYFGTLEFREFYNYNATQTKERHVRLISAGDIGGTVLMRRRTILEPDMPQSDMTVANLTLDAEAILALNYDKTIGKSAVITVTNTLTIHRPIQVIAAHGVSIAHADAFDVPLLKAPHGVTLNAADFTIHDYNGTTPPFNYDAFNHVDFHVETDADGLSTLYVRKYPRIHLTMSDGNNEKRVSFARDSSTSNGWSNVLYPDPANDYYVDSGRALRTPTGSNTFAGHALTMGGNALLTGRGRLVGAADLRLIGGVILTDYATGDAGDGANALNPFAGSGTLRYTGRIRLRNNGFTGGSEKVEVKMSIGRYIRVESEISGRGRIDVYGYWEGQNHAEQVGWVEFAGLNTNWLGCTRVWCDSKTDTTRNFTMPSWGSCPKLVVNDPRNLGGSFTNFVYNALQLECYAQLWPRSTMTLDDASRGIYVNGTGRFLVSNVTFTVKERITYNGELIKEGPGRLRLGGSLDPLFSASGATTPTANKNKFTVMGGELEPLNACVFNGVAMTFSNDTAVVLSPQPDTTAGVGLYGMLNLNGGSISVPEGTVKVKIENGNGIAKPPSKDFLLPLCTVADAATAEALKEKFVMDGGSPWRGYPLMGWATRVNTGANAGSVTLGLVFGGPGTTVLFR
ncbi:MAG: hypothetical protein IJL17_07975 [Kiritimatiellae bacterium]|nr:hypothetical protein [Kiritimatiellia bacterium]